MELISCHGLTKNINSTVILACQSRFLNYYSARGSVILQKNSNQLSIFPNDVKLRIHSINKQKIDQVIACYTEISSLKNTIKKLQILSTLHSIYQKNFCHDKQDIIVEIFFYQYYLPLLKYIDHPALIQEWKQNIDSAAYEKI